LAFAQLDLPLSINPGEQGYTTEREFRSPVTGETFMASVLSRGVGYGVRDYDGCPHPPINALAYSLVICPQTGYVAYPEDFQRATIWQAEELAALLGKPRFNRDAPESLPWAGAFGWEKFENAAKLAEASRARAAGVANWWLQAAWCVRLDLLPAQEDFRGELMRAVDELPEARRDPADVLTPYTLQLANAWARHARGETPQGQANVAAATAPEESPSIRVEGEPPPMVEDGFIADGTGGATVTAAQALVIAWAYRSRGELVAAREWLARAAQLDATVRSGTLFSYLDNGITLEREYLSKAQRWLRQAYDNGEIRENQRGAAAFNLGEIARRLGDREAALQWYGEAAGKSLGTVSPKLVQRQRALVESKSPYA
jgi:tetratricopeptide (TPR) repeat protein